MNKHFIYINSGDYSNPSNFTYNLNNQINDIKKIVVKSYEIPNSYYIITSSNNTLNFEDNVAASYSVNVTAGNYTPNELASTLTTLMAAVYAGSSCSYSDNTYKLTFSNASNIKILSSSTISNIIGLSGDSSLSSSVEMTNAVNLTNSFIYLNTNLFSGSTLPFINNNTKPYIRIQNNTNQGNYIIHNDDNDICFNYSTYQNFRNINFQLIDKDENELDLNGLSFSLELVIYN